MKKSILAGMLLTSTLLMGSEYGLFAGLEISNDRVELDYDAKSDYEFGGGIRAGFVAENSRIYGVYNYNNELKMHTFMAMTEGITDPYAMTDWLSTSFFVGGHVGFNTIDLQDGADNVTRVGYGAQAGIILDFNKRLNAEAGYRYTWSELVHVDAINGAYVAVNFNF